MACLRNPRRWLAPVAMCDVKPGYQINRWTVLDVRRVAKPYRGQDRVAVSTRVRVRCACGTTRWTATAADANNIMGGRSHSCGCARTRLAEVGERHARLEVEAVLPRRAGMAVRLRVRCDCGTRLIMPNNRFVRRPPRSCGCYKADYQRIRNTQHGDTKSPVHRRWCNMLCIAGTSSRRRQRPKMPFEREWYDYRVFAADLGERPIGARLRRRVAARGFVRGNVYWGP